MDKPQTSARWRIVFSGRVQHVGFRYTALYLAKRLYLSGFADNLPDGRVVVEAQGSVAAIRKLLLELKSQKHIHIERMEITELSPDPAARYFEVRGYD